MRVTRALLSGSGLAASALVATVLLGTAQAKAQCAGNACSSVSMNWTGACYVATNNGSRNVKVDVRPYGGIAPLMSRVLTPGGTWTLTMYPTGACLTGYIAPFQANFEIPPAPPAVAHPAPSTPNPVPSQPSPSTPSATNATPPAITEAHLQQINLGGVTSGPAADSDPLAIVYYNQVHVLYRDGSGKIWDSWYDGAGHWNLQQINVNGMTQGPAAASAPAPFVYNNQFHVVYSDGDGTIWDGWYDPAGGWNLQQLNRGGLTNGAAAESYFAPFVYKKEAHVVYRIENGTIWDAWYDGAGHWHLSDMGHGLSWTHYAFGDPAAFVYNDQAHVVYRNSSGKIMDSRYGGNDQQINVGGVTNGPAADTDPVPFVYNNQVHILYVDGEGTIWDSWCDAAGHWNLQHINRDGMTAGPATNSLPAPFVYNTQAHILYRDSSGKIQDSWYDSATGAWSLRRINLGGLTFGPTADNDPVPLVYLNQVHVIYQESGGKIWDSWYVNRK